MNILFLAPHPFYQERGTPIAVDLLLGVLSRRGDRVDVVTFHEGLDRDYPGVTLHRIPRLPGVRGIRPGFSFKKLLCDAFVMAKALRLARRGRYHLVHAVEESAFMALVIRALLGIPYVFDMDSSMPGQLAETSRVLAWLAPLLRAFERLAIRHAFAVVPMCDDLARQARRAARGPVLVLRDVSLLDPASGAAPACPLLAGIVRPCFLYVGNFEPYQGLGLLLESMARLSRTGVQASLLMAGGTPAHIRRYAEQARRLGIADRTHFLGPWPVARLAALLAEADVLVSPRTGGGNTPMKIYSYLAAGKPILATDRPTHTQVLTPEVAVLTAPEPEAFAAGMRRLIEHPDEGRTLAGRARALALERYSPAAFERDARALYAQLEAALRGA